MLHRKVRCGFYQEGAFHFKLAVPAFQLAQPRPLGKPQRRLFAGVLRFPGNVVALFDSGTAMTARDELEAIGSEGSLFLDDPWHCQVPGIELRREGRVERIEVDLVDSYRLELENLTDAIRGDAELLLGRDDAVAQARVLEALHDSATRGTPVSL